MAYRLSALSVIGFGAMKVQETSTHSPCGIL